MKPYKIAKEKGALIVGESLGNVYGYYNNVEGQKFIHVNDELPEYFQRYVVAHLLYAVVNDIEGMIFLKRKTGLHFTPTEAEANAFAMNLLFPKSELAQYSTPDELCAFYGLTESEVADLNFRLRRVWGGKTLFEVVEELRSRTESEQ